MDEADEEIKEDEIQAPTFPINLTVENGIDKRTKIIKELYTSENIYVTNLKQMINGYLEPLKKDKILTSKVISGIFSNVEIIYKFHLFFSTSLTQKVESWDDDQLIGDIFLSMAPYLKLYSQYCANYDYSISLVQLHKKTNPQFNQFLVDCQKNELFKGSYITSFLILPIQRIPRYEMFLKELLKKTRENHPDAKNIAKSLDLVSELAKSVNESCEKAENINKITEISKAINMEKLLKPTRVYCREDDVELSLEGYVSNSKCYIFNDLIVLTIKKSKVISKNYISYQLGLSWIYEKTADAIQMVTPTVTMIIKFADINTKISWQTEVTNNINKLAERSSKIKKQRAEYRIEEAGGLFVAHSIAPTENAVEHTGEKRRKKNRLLDSWRTDKRSKSKSKRITIAVSEPTVSISNSASLSQSFLESAPEKRKSLPHDKLLALEAVLSARGSQSNDAREKFRSSKTNTLSRSNQSSAELNINNYSLYGTSGKMKAKKKRRDISDIFNQMNSVSTDA